MNTPPSLFIIPNNFLPTCTEIEKQLNASIPKY